MVKRANSRSLLSMFCILFFLMLSINCISQENGKQTKVREDNIKKPNVIFILAGDLGVHDLSSMGSTFYETPNIDQIAKNGTVFTQGYSASRVCSPARASIMTGKFTARHGITDWIGAPEGKDWRKYKRDDELLPAEYMHNLPKADTTLAQAMRDAGYKTLFAGKGHLGSKGSWPEDHGFDVNKGGFHRAYDLDIKGETWNIQGETERATMEFDEDGSTYKEFWEIKSDVKWRPLCRRTGKKHLD